MPQIRPVALRVAALLVPYCVALHSKIHKGLTASRCIGTAAFRAFADKSLSAPPSQGGLAFSFIAPCLAPKLPATNVYLLMHPAMNEYCSVASFACLDLPEGRKDISGMKQKGEIIASAAVDLVVNQLQANETGIPQDAKVVMISGNWIEGTTISMR